MSHISSSSEGARMYRDTKKGTIERISTIFRPLVMKSILSGENANLKEKNNNSEEFVYWLPQNKFQGEPGNAHSFYHSKLWIIHLVSFTVLKIKLNFIKV